MSIQTVTSPVLWEVATACGACGGTEWKPEFAIHGRRYGRCSSCAIVRLVDRVAECDVAVLYDDYYPKRVPVGDELERALANPTFASRRQHIESALGKLPRRLFEAGCGDGNFLLTMKRAGWEVSGSEHGDTARVTAQRHQIAVTSADLIGGEVQEVFSVVAAYHLLEHIYRPAEWLRAARRMLVSGGLLHLQVPNYASLTRPLTGEGWASWRFPQHVYFYSPATLAGLLTRQGFVVEACTTWDPWHGPGTATDSLAHRIRALSGGRSPWEAEVQRRGAAAGTDRLHVAARSTTPRLARAALEVMGSLWSRIESSLARGAVVDVIARRP